MSATAMPILNRQLTHQQQQELLIRRGRASGAGFLQLDPEVRKLSQVLDQLSAYCTLVMWFSSSSEDCFYASSAATAAIYLFQAAASSALNVILDCRSHAAVSHKKLSRGTFLG
jgi:hypothetical protein